MVGWFVDGRYCTKISEAISPGSKLDYVRVRGLVEDALDRTGQFVPSKSRSDTQPPRGYTPGRL